MILIKNNLVIQTVIYLAQYFVSSNRRYQRCYRNNSSYLIFWVYRKFLFCLLEWEAVLYLEGRMRRHIPPKLLALWHLWVYFSSVRVHNLLGDLGQMLTWRNIVKLVGYRLFMLCLERVFLICRSVLGNSLFSCIRREDNRNMRNHFRCCVGEKHAW